MNEPVSKSITRIIIKSLITIGVLLFTLVLYGTKNIVFAGAASCTGACATGWHCTGAGEVDIGTGCKTRETYCEVDWIVPITQFECSGESSCSHCSFVSQECSAWPACIEQDRTIYPNCCDQDSGATPTPEPEATSTPTPTPIPSCTLSLTPATATIAVGGTKTLTASLSQVKNGSVSGVTFVSSNGHVTVSLGANPPGIYKATATGVSAGQATITAKGFMNGVVRCSDTSVITVSTPTPTPTPICYSCAKCSTNKPGYWATWTDDTANCDTVNWCTAPTYTCKPASCLSGCAIRYFCKPGSGCSSTSATYDSTYDIQCSSGSICDTCATNLSKYVSGSTGVCYKTLAACNSACSASTPTPTPTPTKSPTPTPGGPTPTKSPTPTPGGPTPTKSPTPTPGAPTPSPTPMPAGAWWQVKDGDVQTNGDLDSSVPATATDPFFDLKGLGGFPGVAKYWGSTNLTWANVSEKHWLANSSYTPANGRVQDYAYFRRLIPEDVTLNPASSFPSEGTPSGTPPNQYYWYEYNGLVTGLPFRITSSVNLPPGRKVVLLVTGADLNIEGSINYTSGRSILVVLADQNINIYPSVGGAVDPNFDLMGFFLADNNISTGVSSKSLRFKGSVAALGSLILLNQRDLAGDNATKPAEFFEYDPASAFLFPPKLQVEKTRWKEIAP